MCGFVFISVKSTSNDLVRRKVERGLQAIQHRGPDSQGIWVDDAQEGVKIGIGHVRLSILDQSLAGNQPMFSSDQKIAMAFNGEIYNYEEIRKKIHFKNFNSTSDSEVLLEGYAEHGVEWFQHLRGMFAAVFCDKRKNETVLVRDQLGVKPIYYYQNNTIFAACSEIKGLKAIVPEIGELCKNSLFEFLSCGFVFEPDTGLVGVKKVPPGCFLVVKNGVTKIINYFDIETATKSVLPVSIAISDAILNQTNADAKIGVFFSGGLDSSIIASTVNLPCLFAKYSDSATPNNQKNGDEEAVDGIGRKLGFEVKKILVADQLDSHENIIKAIKQVVIGNEELISDFTFYASKTLSSAAKERGFKVMLSGMGGDESFIGYPRYKILIQHRKYKLISWIIRLIKRSRVFSGNIDVITKSDRLNAYYNESEFVIAYSRLLGYFDQEELRGLISDTEYVLRVRIFNEKCGKYLGNMTAEANISKALILDYYGFLSHNLMVADKSSMIEGIELRVPLLDQDLYCQNIARVRRDSKAVKYGKVPIRNLLEKLVGSKILNRRKVGFNPPLDKVINNLGSAKIKELVFNTELLEVVDKGAVEVLIDEHFAGRKYNALKLWQMLYLSFWLSEKKA